MSNVIDFNARDFKFDASCSEQNVGSRMFITDMFDKATEIFEIGNFQSQTQICCEKVLDKDTDYVFRFGVLRESAWGNTISQFILVPENSWEDRFVFSLTNDEFKPSAIKKWNGADFRVYEIPFNTGNVSNYRFVIVQGFATARIFPAKEVLEYCFLEDSTHDGSRFGKGNFNFDFEKMKSNLDIDTEAVKKDISHYGKAAESTIKSAFGKISSIFSGSTDAVNTEKETVVTADQASTDEIMEDADETGEIIEDAADAVEVIEDAADAVEVIKNAADAVEVSQADSCVPDEVVEKTDEPKQICETFFSDNAD